MKQCYEIGSYGGRGAALTWKVREGLSEHSEFDIVMGRIWGMSGPGNGRQTCKILEVGKSWAYLRNRKDRVDGKQRMRETVGCDGVEEVGRDQIT